MEQAIGHGLQGEHEQERAEEETIGGLGTGQEAVSTVGRTQPSTIQRFLIAPQPVMGDIVQPRKVKHAGLL